MFMQFTYMLRDLPQVAESVLLNTIHKTLLIYGEMGVGKTTLVKELAKKIGVTEILSSPTFSIVNEYPLENDKLYHFDCYRLETTEEALDIGIEDYLSSGHWNLIEWPEKIKKLLPASSATIEIIKNPNGSRTLNLKLLN
jgi:tRNA threonylcarbamoyladenosine biosynthesis protein TsaE